MESIIVACITGMVTLVMAVLSPVMAALGGGDGDKPEIPRGEVRGA